VRCHSPVEGKHFICIPDASVEGSSKGPMEKRSQPLAKLLVRIAWTLN